ncbi:MAG: hypothetical protein R3B84_01980 [Zavarzinella sp.]
MSAGLPHAQVPTRQQLEEIDAMIKRMLALPPLASEVPVEDSAPPVVKSWKVEIPEPGEPGELKIQPDPEPSLISWGKSVANPDDIQPPKASGYFAKQPATVGTSGNSPDELPQPQIYHGPGAQPPIVEAPPAPQAAVGAGELEEVPFAESATRRGMPNPLILINMLYDAITWLLWPLTGVLRNQGRTWLGRIGVFMLIAAAGWAIGEMYGYSWPHIPWGKYDPRTLLGKW